MSNELEILYTAEATVAGGREGHGRTSDGRVNIDLDVPKEMGGEGGPGTNPEQLFAVGYAACFQSALIRLAAGRKLVVAALAGQKRPGPALAKALVGPAIGTLSVTVVIISSPAWTIRRFDF